MMDTRTVCYVAAILLFVGFVNGDVCQTFAGGAVYPRETGKSSGHSLQWTKAMSMYKVIFPLIKFLKY